MKLAEVVPDGYRAMAAVERYLAHADVEKRLHNLVKIRETVQINGCAFCIDLHTREPREPEGEDCRVFRREGSGERPHGYRDHKRL